MNVCVWRFLNFFVLETVKTCRRHVVHIVAFSRMCCGLIEIHDNSMLQYHRQLQK